MKKIIMFIFTINTMIQAQLPVSREAKIVEVVSSNEVMIEATGIYNGVGKKAKKKRKDVDKVGVPNAILDSKRSALYYLLFGGTDPILSAPDERQKFGYNEQQFFSEGNLVQYITYEDPMIVKKIKVNEGQSLKIIKRYKINKKLLVDNLVGLKIIESQAELTSQLGNPYIMVIPSVSKGQSPIDELRNNKEYKHAASVVESYLTARQYEVVVPEQQESMAGLQQAQLDLGDRGEDFAYQMALSVGSDVYLEFSGVNEDAGYGTKKYAITLRAYETTTARLLGTETGYSQGRKGELMVSVEEAMNDAIDKVLSRVRNYWKKDVDKGVQYKMVFSISDDFDEDEIEEIQFALMDAIEEVSNNSKENIVTNQTMDYLIWCDAGVYDKSSQVYRYVKKYFNKQGTSGTLRKVNVNRKMLILKVDYD